MPTITLAIDGMSCQNCVRHVTRALGAVPGVVVGDVTIGHATVEATGEAAVEAAVRVLTEEGYPARPIQAG